MPSCPPGWRVRPLGVLLPNMVDDDLEALAVVAPLADPAAQPAEVAGNLDKTFYEKKIYIFFTFFLI